MKRICTFILLFVFLSATTFAQEFGKQNVDRNGNPTFVKFDTKVQSASKAETKAVLSSLLNMTSNDEYKTIESEKDQIGYTHEKFQQYFKGFKVVNGVYFAHSQNNVLESVNGDYKLINDINVTPSISSANAIENAKAFINAKVYMKEDKATESKPELVIVEHNFGKSPKSVKEMVLAYRVDVYATQPLSRDYVYVNANTGEIVHVNAILVTASATGSAVTRYSGTKSITTDSYNGSYRLRDYSRGNGIITYNCNEGTSYTSAVDFTDANNSWTAAEYDNSDKDNGALDAHWAGMVTYDYFKNTHSRNSFDGNNALMKTYVHFDVNYDNAYWNGSVFTFGDGNSFDILTSLDVFGHEFGHALCSYTANLNYENESGALNEAFSDIWGCVIEYYYAPEKDTWLMGEDLGSALRSLSNPKLKGLPDTYMGDNWAPLSSSPSQSNDYGGVHTNNGPYCHWFYLISEGGSGTNDNNDSYSVSAIGITKAEKIAYRVESVYMTSTSDYDDARTYSIQAAQDLYGVDSQEEISVTNAMYAVGVGSAYGGGSSSYCQSKGSSYSDEWIAQVKLGSFTKSSAGSSYSDFTSSTINVNAGETYALTLTPGFSGSAYNEYWKIWIDYNDNTIFDSNELVYDAGALNNSAVSGNITIPSGISGVRRMRVSMKYNGAQTACETFDYGEVEDYNITIGSGSSSGDTDLTLTITFDNYPEETSWTLKTSGGTSVASGGTYASQADGSTLNIPINGVDDGCYVFTLLDSYGDGICCAEGNGSYTLKVTGGATIASGGSFTSSDVTNFCLPYTSFNLAATTSSIDNEIAKPAFNVYPNPASTYINVQVANAKANSLISIYNATGALVKVVEMDESEREVDISELPSGLYLISVDTKKKTITKQFIKK
ncbi:MAG: T9SS type A sorting domain-containing protein [Bacteroidales bacterium]|nr:T9SS type A sorting domain-containing protein [Bacteroidales bacterium]